MQESGLGETAQENDTAWLKAAKKQTEAAWALIKAWEKRKQEVGEGEVASSTILSDLPLVTGQVPDEFRTDKFLFL